MRKPLLAVLAAVLVAAPAAAASPTALIRDCLQNGRVTGHYPPRDYSQALSNLPTDVQEYSDCADVIRRAQLAAASGQATPAGAANPRQNPLLSAAPAERTAVARARQGGSAPLDVGGRLVRPGVVAVRTSSIFNNLPTPLLVAMAALLSIALAVAGWRTMNLVRARRSR